MNVHDEHTRPSVGELFARLNSEVRELVSAEVGFYKVEATRRARSAGIAAGLVIGAALLALATLGALLIGLIMIVASELGVGWAVLIVVLGGFALAGLLGWLGVRAAKRAIDPDAMS